MRADYREWRTVREVQKSPSHSAAPFLSPSRPRRLLLAIPSRPSSESSGPSPATHSSRRLTGLLQGRGALGIPALAVSVGLSSTRRFCKDFRNLRLTIVA